MTDFLFLRPVWLFALVPLAVALWRMRRHAARGGWAAVIDPHLAPAMLTSGARGPRFDSVLMALAAILAVVALAGPAVRGDEAPVWRADAARVLVVDLSPAMTGGKDGPLGRLRPKLLDWLREMDEGETALVVYGEEPYLVAPLTTDAATLVSFVPELEPEAIPLGGDRPERALAMAARLLEDSGAARRDVVWFSVAADAEAARAAAAQRPPGVRLSLLHLADAPIASLREAVEASGGRYASFSADGADVRTLAGAMRTDALAAAGPRSAAVPRDLGPWLLLPALLLAAFGGRRALAVASLAMALPFAPAAPGVHAAEPGPGSALAWSPGRGAEADPRWQAVALYRAGRYAEAASALAPLHDADSHYNRGNALAHLRDYPAALAAYEASLALRPDDADALHNRDLVRRLLDGRKRAPDPNAAGHAGEPPPASVADREAAMLAEQWLRRVPDEPATLLRAKLAQEHRRRQAAGERPW